MTNVQGGEMKTHTPTQDDTRVTCLAWAVVIGMTVCLLSSPAGAFTFEKGELTGALDITLGYGLSVRTEKADPHPNAPNQKADFTFEDGIVSNVGKVTAEFSADWRNFGVVANVNYTYDYNIMNKGTDRQNGVFNGDLAGLPLDTGKGDDWTKDAEDASGSVLDLLEAYGYGTFFQDTLDLRVGKQVINWGEGLFFLNGVSQQTPLNFNKLLLPGSELKEAYFGLPAIYPQWAATDNLSLAGYYQWGWEKTSFPGVGTFYGDDLLGPGGQEEWANAPAGLAGIRGEDFDASNDGQFGLSGRYFLGNVEYGLYYSRYHDPLPVLTFTNGGATAHQTYLEDLDLYGASFSTTLGTWSVAGEVAYRPDQPLLTDPDEFLFVSNGQAWEEHDTVSASVNGIWLGGPLVLGIDSQVVLAQLGMDYVDGDRSRLAPQGDITNDPDATVDAAAWGAAFEWDGTWQAVVPNLDITLLFFIQYDFSGNSHNWGNFAEGRLLTSTGLTFAYGSPWEFNINYARMDFSKSNFETRDTVNFSVNYKF
jgi:hypothetical protein